MIKLILMLLSSLFFSQALIAHSPSRMSTQSQKKQCYAYFLGTDLLKFLAPEQSEKIKILAQEYVAISKKTNGMPSQQTIKAQIQSYISEMTEHLQKQGLQEVELALRFVFVDFIKKIEAMGQGTSSAADIQRLHAEQIFRKQSANSKEFQALLEQLKAQLAAKLKETPYAYDLESLQKLPPEEIDRAFAKAAKEKSILGVYVFYKLGARVDSQYKLKTAFMHALGNKDYNMAKFLIFLGANIDALCEVGHNALTWALLAKNDFETVKFLIENGADVNFTFTNTESVLVHAFREKHIEGARMLIRAGANINKKSGRGWSILNYVLSADYTEGFDLLLNEGVDLTQRTDARETFLIKAAEYGYTEGIKRLLDAGVEKEDVDASGRTALMAAIEVGNAATVETLKLLLDRGAIVNAATMEFLAEHYNAEMDAVLTPYLKSKLSLKLQLKLFFLRQKNK